MNINILSIIADAYGTYVNTKKCTFYIPKNRKVYKWVACHPSPLRKVKSCSSKTCPFFNSENDGVVNSWRYPTIDIAEKELGNIIPLVDL